MNSVDYYSINQRDTYRLVENLTSKRFKSELSLLKSLVKDIVSQDKFEINGGRIWELLPEQNAYILRFQYGNVKRIPTGYTMQVTDHPALTNLAKKRASLHYETDELLKKKGIELYSVAGVGELIKLKSGKYYKYALGFNAPQILQSFYETLIIISNVATIALRNQRWYAEQKLIRQDILKASEIQKNLLPDHYLEFRDYKIFGVCVPDQYVGGDYFDYLKPADDESERVGIVISDAASKGLPAAIQALFVSGAIRMGMAFASRISALLSRINSLIFETFPYERFVTLFYCELTSSSNGLVLYANAGHCAPIHYCNEDGSIELLKQTGGLLGIMQNQKITVENISMKKGDVLVMFTDGIIEARNNQGEFFTTQRVAEVVQSKSEESAETIAYSILEEVQKFSSGSIHNDDKTIVVIKRDKE